MNRTTKNILVSIIVLVGLISLSFLFILFPDLDSSTNIVEILFVASAISSILTLLVALLLFNKFGIEKDILQKNLKAISSIFEILAKTNISINMNDGSWHFINLLRDLREGRFSEFKHYGNKIVAGDITAISGLTGLSALGESIFMPKEIAVHVRKIAVGVIKFSEDIEKKPHKYAFIQFQDAKKTVYSVELDKETEDTKVGLLNGKELEFKEYLQMFDDLYKSCQKWLKKNSNIKLDLNS